MYRIIYSIELSHAYFSDGKGRGFRVSPSPGCRRLLARQKMTFRHVGNRAYVLGWADGNSVPVIPLDSDAVFQFYLIADDPEFFDLTALPYDAATSSRLYLSNLAANKVDSRLYLSKPDAAFDTGKNYASGMLVTDGGNLFECVQSLAANPGNATSDATHWAARGAVRAPGPDDLLVFANSGSTLKLAGPVSNVTVNVFGLNRASNQLDAVVTSTVLNFATATDTIPVSLQNLPPGRYRIAAGGLERVLYYDPGLQPASVVGVVEIFNHLAGADDYSLLDGLGQAKGSTFSALFLNPLVIWKYIARTANVKKVRDESGLYDFDDSVPLEFRSKTPIPLTEVAYDQISLDYKPPASAQTSYTKIANPSLGNRKQVTVGSDTLPCAEVHLHY